jgi:GNAT superfamily N-acetyltransferase
MRSSRVRRLLYKNGDFFGEVDGAQGDADLGPDFGDLEGDRLPQALRRKLPSYPLPVLRLARLAVDASVQRQGLGKQLLRFVMDFGSTRVAQLPRAASS